MSVTKTAAPQKKPFYKILYVQVLVAIVLGAIVGWLFPDSPRTTGSRRWATASSS